MVMPLLPLIQLTDIHQDFTDPLADSRASIQGNQKNKDLIDSNLSTCNMLKTWHAAFEGCCVKPSPVKGVEIPDGGQEVFTSLALLTKNNSKKRRRGRAEQGRRRTSVNQARKWKTNLGENDTAWLKFPTGFWICPRDIALREIKEWREWPRDCLFTSAPVVICALMRQLLLVLWRKGASPVLLYGLSAAQQEDLSALILSSERAVSGPICHRLLWEWHAGDDLLTCGWLAKKAPPRWFFH